MDKSPEAFRTISEVADWLGTPTHVLRFWESRFTQIKPVKRAGGRRYYRPRDMELLGGIKKLLHDDGMTIRGVQKLLREEGVHHVSALSPRIDAVGDMDLATGDVIEAQVIEAQVIETQMAEAPMAVDVPPAQPQNVVPIKAAPTTAPAAKRAATGPDTSTPDAIPAPGLGPRGDVLIGPDETPVTYRAGKGQQAPVSPPVALGDVVPDDPSDTETNPPGAISLVGALRRAKATNRPNAADTKVATDLFRRLSALRKRMGSGSDPDPAQ